MLTAVDHVGAQPNARDALTLVVLYIVPILGPVGLHVPQAVYTERASELATCLEVPAVGEDRVRLVRLLNVVETAGMVCARLLKNNSGGFSLVDKL